VGELVAKLPLVDMDPKKHFTKQGKYRTEIRNLIKCQGGVVPGGPLSPHIVQLRGRSTDGKLVFDKCRGSAGILGRFSSVSTYKRSDFTSDRRS
jgi:hypothetical protein